MNKKKLLFAASINSLLIFAQEGEDLRLKVDFFGYIFQETFVDSRQIIAKDDGTMLLLPKPRLNDVLGKDINGKAYLNMNAIRTRVGSAITGPKVGNAKTSGFIEVDFIGRSEIVNVMRMRHAYLKLKWPNDEFLAGHTFHPLTIEKCLALTIGENNGRPIESYARNPQVRYTHKFKHCDFVATVISQLSDRSLGPIGPSGTYIRNAIIPNLNIKLEHTHNDHFMGIAGDFKRLVPRLVTDNDFKAHESIISYALIAYTKLWFNPLEARLKLIYCQNSSEFSMIGGYGVHCIDPITDHREYANIRALSLWGSFDLRWPISPGIFIGYSKNLGAPQEVIPYDSAGNSLIYTLEPTLNDVFRIAPRIRWRSKSLEITGELEWTRAAYGIIQPRGNVHTDSKVSVVRTLLDLIYYF